VDFMKANHFQGLPPSTTLNELPAIRRNWRRVEGEWFQGCWFWLPNRHNTL
jgi:hypothetical protein